MNLRRTLAFTRRILLQFRHDRRTLAFVLVVPILMMLIFGYTFGGEPKGLKIAVVNLDEKIQIIDQENKFSIAELIATIFLFELILVTSFTISEELISMNGLSST